MDGEPFRLGVVFIGAAFVDINRVLIVNTMDISPRIGSWHIDQPERLTT